MHSHINGRHSHNHINSRHSHINSRHNHISSRHGHIWCWLCSVGLQSRNSSDGLLEGGDVLILNLLLIPIAKIVKLINSVITLIVITVIRHNMGHI